MILLDIDNLNILVLFILAFISFKSYQADHHQIESESQSEISEVEDVKKDVDAEQKQEENPQMRSQSPQNDVEYPQLEPECQQEKIKNYVPSQMINEQLLHSQNQPQLDGIQDGENQLVKVDGNLDVNGENGPKQFSQNEGVQLEKCDEQISNEENNSEESLKNPESESYSEQGDDQDQDDRDQSNIPPEKRKKIHKTGRKVRKQLRKQIESVGELREQIEIQ